MDDEPIYQIYPPSVLDVWRDAAKALAEWRAKEDARVASLSRWGRFKRRTGQRTNEARYRVRKAWDVLRGWEE